MEFFEIEIGDVLELRHKEQGWIRLVVIGIQSFNMECRSIAKKESDQESWQSCVGRSGIYDMRNNDIVEYQIVKKDEIRVR